MVKKYTIIALGALMLGVQANGASYWQAFKNKLGFGSNVAPIRPIQKTADGKYNFIPQDLINACKRCKVAIVGSDKDNWVHNFKGRKSPKAVVTHIGYLAFAAKENAPLGQKRLAEQDVLDQGPCILEQLLDSEDAKRLTDNFDKHQESSRTSRDFSRASSYESINTRQELLENLALQERDNIRMALSPRLSEFGRRTHAAEAMYARCSRKMFLAAKEPGDLDYLDNRCRYEYAHLNTHSQMIGNFKAWRSDLPLPKEDHVEHDSYTAEKSTSALWRVLELEQKQSK